jgi:iron complex transport system permease protein
VITLLLAGVAVSAMLTALQTLLLTFTPRLGLQLYSIYNWIAGEITVREWPQLAISALLLALCLVATLFLAPVLDAFALGEEMTAHLGLAVERYKLIIVALGALLVAVAVSMSGLVGFVGLVSPHLCRLAFGPRHRLLLPTTALTGAIFVVLADLLARTVAAPNEIPLGVVTALVGGPFFLSLLSHAGDRYRW